MVYVPLSRPDSNQSSSVNPESPAHRPADPCMVTPPSSLCYPPSLLQASYSRSGTWAFPSSPTTLNPGSSDPHLQPCAHRSRHLWLRSPAPRIPDPGCSNPRFQHCAHGSRGGDLPPIPAWRIPFPSPATLEPHPPPAQGSPDSSPGDYGLQLYAPIPAELTLVSSTHST